MEPNQPQSINDQPQPTETIHQPLPSPIPDPSPRHTMMAPAAPHTHTGAIILQWLTYALWGWTVLAMSFLTATVIDSFIGDSNVSSGAPYAIAAILVLLPMSVVCDVYYSKQEPEKKIGPASLVMIVHAVLFALIAVGSLIAAVFSLVNMFTSSSESTATKVTLYTSIIVTLLYAAVLLRTLRPPKFTWMRRYFIIFMVMVVGIISVLGVLGPVKNARLTRTDRLIEGNLTIVSESVNSYANKNHQLPGDLNSLDLSGDAKKLVKDNLVTYQPNVIQPAIINDTSNGSSDLSVPNLNYTYYYQMCVNFKKANKQPWGSSDYLDKDGFSNSYLSTYSHGSGKTCYKIKTTSYNL